LIGVVSVVLGFRMANERSADAVTVGKKAPSFSLKKEDDSTVRLSDHKGRWLVLYFYPKDDTPGCTTEACEFTAGIKSFEKLDAVVLGCSPDTTEAHRKFIAKHRLKVSLLSDPEKTTLEAYGAWGEKMMYGKTVVGVIRSTVIINPEGKIAHRWARVKTAGHAEDVRQTLAELRAAAE
jgi:thioredoxin-dependent peroxiredoxin